MSVRTGTPQTALEAVTWRRLPISSWPWRSAGYVLVTLPVAVVAAAGLAIPAVPWLMLAGGYQAGVVALLILLGGVLIAALGPLIAIPVTALGIWRLRLVDTRPVQRRAALAVRPALWLRTRYTDPQAWREVGYACMLVTVVLALCVAALVAVLLTGTFVASRSWCLRNAPAAARSR